MIEDLRALIDMVAGLPAMAAWIVAGFGIYKLATWASVVGALTYVVNLAIERWAQDRRERRDAELAARSIPEVKILTADEMVGVGLIDSARIPLAAQLSRIRNKVHPEHKSPFIHRSDVDWLRKAIDAAEVAEREGSVVRKISA